MLDRAALSAVEQPAIAPALPQEFRDVFENPPLVYRVAEPEGEPYRIRRNAIRRDYLSREARNSSLGSAGEAFVVALERYRLASAGNSRLSDHVEHVSKTKGDGLGYDVLSFEADGRERFIEVKTTAFGKETPFFVSHNALNPIVTLHRNRSTVGLFLTPG